VNNTLKDSWSLILGASGGIGSGCALALSGAGSHILGVHLDRAARQPDIEALQDRIRANGVQARYFNDNAASAAGRERVIAEIVKLTGDDGVRVFVHSLAFGALVPFMPTEEGRPVVEGRQLDMTLSVMAHSLVLWTQDLFRAGLLRPGAKIFALTSGGATRVSLGYGAVSAAKCALEAHVRQIAVELAPHGVAVNGIRAGMTLTESFLLIPESGVLAEAARTRNPHGRLTTPEDVGEAVVLLAQAGSSWVTGNVINVDGGENLTI
jgi:NAD(P)-dependent dehydrogenase (short-subunit alcohol dehydrogenase family)